MSSVKDKIHLSLKTDGSDATLRKWVSYIVERKIPLPDLQDLIHAEKPVAMRFSWLLGGICELQPSVVYPSVTYFFSKRHEIQIVNFNRSLAKMFWLAGVPLEIEGEAIDEMVKWLLDPKTIVSTKAYALSALYELTHKYPELKNEIKLVIEDQLDKNTIAFRKRAEKVLKDMGN
jgi:hypothetical protein